MLHIELYRPERKGRYVKDDTAITRPDDRTLGREQRRASGQTERQNEMKKV